MTASHIFGHNFPDSWSSEHSILPKTRAESGVDAVTTLANDQDCSVAYSIFPDLLLFSKQVRDYILTFSDFLGASTFCGHVQIPFFKSFPESF